MKMTQKKYVCDIAVESYYTSTTLHSMDDFVYVSTINPLQNMALGVALSGATAKTSANVQDY